MAPPLIVIAGAFTLTGLGIRGLDWLEHGRARRVRVDEFVYSMDHRDKAIDAAKKAPKSS